MVSIGLVELEILRRPYAGGICVEAVFFGSVAEIPVEPEFFGFFEIQR